MRLTAMVPFALRRVRADRGSVAVLAATVSLLCTLVVATVAGLSTLTTTALRTGLVSAPASQSTVRISTTYDNDSPAAQNTRVRGLLRWLLEPVGGSIVSTTSTVDYDLASLGSGQARTTFWSVRASRDRLKLLRGDWPKATNGHGPLPVAVYAPMAQRFDLRVGDRFRVASRLDEAVLTVEVAGVFSLRDRGGGWADRPLLRDGTVSGSDATTWGPLLTAAEDFDVVAGPVASARWRAVPDWQTLTPERLDELRARAAALDARLPTVLHRQPGSGISLRNPLPGLLREQAHELVTLRSVALMPAGLLGVFGVCGILLVARSLTTARAEQQALLRSRGASASQLIRPAAAEATVIGLLGAGIGPPLAALVYAIAGNPVPLRGWLWLVSAATALACSVALVLPAMVTAARREGAGSANRRDRRAMTLRVAGVLLVLALGALGAGQLIRYGVTAGAGGRPRIDPVLVTAPALVLLAGTALAMMLLWPLTRLANRLANGRRGLGAAVGTSAVSRSPAASLPLALVIALAAGTAGFAVNQLASQEAARTAQAKYRTGAEIRASAAAPARRLGPGAERKALLSTRGVESVAGVYRAADYIRELPVTILATPIRWLNGTALDAQEVSWGLSSETRNELRVPASSDVEAIPVAVTSSVAEALGLSTGDSFVQAYSGVQMRVRVIAVVSRLATVPVTRGGILLDSSALSEQLRQAADRPRPDEWPPPDEWWINIAEEADQREVADRLAELDRVLATITTRAGIAARLSGDPAAGGAGLVLVFRITAMAAAALTMLLLVSATVLRRRERHRQELVLRALGARRRAILHAVGWQYLLIAGLGTLAGLVTGAGLTALVLRALSSGGAAPAPPPSLVVPPAGLLALLAVMVAVPTVVALGIARRDVSATSAVRLRSEEL